MLSVFNVNKRYRSHTKKKASAKGLTRVQSPPSPASFESPAIVEINEQGPFGATVPEGREPSTSIERSAALSPQIQLEFDTSEPLIPPSILPDAGNRTPPKRNVSLPNGGRAQTEPSNSTRARGASPEDSTIWEEPLQVRYDQ